MYWVKTSRLGPLLEHGKHLLTMVILTIPLNELHVNTILVAFQWESADLLHEEPCRTKMMK